uniref:Non-specific serine/threonine protein kinase n=1 Tax=Rhabditophanes sp. KR3021 TaxID=114890 RepID=A0AC35TM06_9BILA
MGLFDSDESDSEQKISSNDEAIDLNWSLELKDLATQKTTSKARGKVNKTIRKKPALKKSQEKPSQVLKPPSFVDKEGNKKSVAHKAGAKNPANQEAKHLLVKSLVKEETKDSFVQSSINQKPKHSSMKSLVKERKKSSFEQSPNIQEPQNCFVESSIKESKNNSFVESSPKESTNNSFVQSPGFQDPEHSFVENLAKESKNNSFIQSPDNQEPETSFVKCPVKEDTHYSLVNSPVKEDIHYPFVDSRAKESINYSFGPDIQKPELLFVESPGKEMVSQSAVENPIKQCAKEGTNNMSIDDSRNSLFTGENNIARKMQSNPKCLSFGSSWKFHSVLIEQDFDESLTDETLGEEKWIGNKTFVMDGNDYDLDDLVEEFNEDAKLMKFTSFFKTTYTLKKVAEGTYGEVFKIDDGKGNKTIGKVIVIRDKNSDIRGLESIQFGSPGELLTEATIAKTLSDLSIGIDNFTSSFIELKRCGVVHDIYTRKMTAAWNKYNKLGVDNYNENPKIYASDSTNFFVMELENGGVTVENRQPKTSEQAISILLQLIFAFRVAEEVLEFEHRDLHESNVMLQKVGEDEVISYGINGQKVDVKSYGRKVKIIDFSLSRMKHNKKIYYKDLDEMDDIFTGDTEQARTYKKMKDNLKGEWEKFRPETNLNWIEFHAKRFEPLLRTNNQFKRISDLLCEELHFFGTLERLVENDFFKRFVKQFGQENE